MSYLYAICREEDGEYVAVPDSCWGYDTEHESVAILDMDEYMGIHQGCETGVSGDGYVDGLQDEESLPEGIYIVVWFRGAQGERREELIRTLDECVDYRITKEQIIANAASGKYVDGAYYCLVG